MFRQINVFANKKEVKAYKKSVSVIVDYSNKNKVSNRLININFNTIVKILSNTNIKNKNKNNKIQLENKFKNNKTKK